MRISPIISVADRISLTLEGLARAVAACSDPRRVGGPLATWLILLVWRRVKRTEVRIQELLRRFQEGRLWMMPARTGSERRGGARRAGAKGGPQRFAWLLPLVPCEAANFASQLRAALAEPEMVGLLRASPQARRILKPVCRMLGIEAAVLEPSAGAVEPEPEPEPAAEAGPTRVRPEPAETGVTGRAFPAFELGGPPFWARGQPAGAGSG